MKYAILSLDIEDWYHVDYFARKKCDRTYSMLDGLDGYLKIIESHQVPSSFFVLGELIPKIKTKLHEILQLGHEIGSHGQSHIRPLTLSTEAFEKEVKSCKEELEDLLGQEVSGYRAPCFSLDRARLDILKQVGYLYDSSRILFGDHPLYGEIDMSGFKKCSSEVYRHEDFFEFQISTLPLGGKQIPISGGGYLRIFPWLLMKSLLSKYLKKEELYVLYIHPFETSALPNPVYPEGASLANKTRFSLGRPSVFNKLSKVIKLLQENDYQFTTFANLRAKLLKNEEIHNKIA